MEYLRFIVAIAIAAILAAGSLLLPEHRFDSNVVALAVFSTALALLLAYCSFRLARFKQRAASSIEEAERLATLLEHSPAALVLLDQQFQPLYINKKFRNLSRLPDNSRREDIADMLARVSEDTRQQALATLRQGRDWEGELHMQLQGQDEYISAVASAIYDAEGNIEQYLISCEDISEHKAIANRLFVREHYNVLTGLPNRQLALKNLQHSIEQRNGFGLLHIDLDRVRYINDSLGHWVVDRLFRSTAERLQRCLRNDQLLAHLGADEFLVVLGDNSCRDEARIFADSLLEIISEPLAIDTHDITLSASIGIALYPDDGDGAETLLRRAEAAMFTAKSRGGGQFCFYEAGMSSQAEQRLETEAQLRRAIEKDEFKLHYQPVVDLSTNKLIGAEVLLRWYNNELKNPGPDRFIGIAEECGLINGIGEWVLINACKQAVRWRHAGLPEMSIAVNISARQFEGAQVVESVKKALKQSGLPAKQLELEITEGLLINDDPKIRECFQQLKALGVKLSLDDFGTGYASLSYLKRYPFDILKIDRSFVHDIDRSGDSMTLVNAIIAMAHSFNMSVIAEGVENLQQRRLLRDHHCDKVQGFLYAPALNAESFEDWANRYREIQQARHV
ncbi:MULTISPECIES: putative bifunctional diguanylate cyclase/phosphodiesterase [Spongiibacter]|uniref:putative bifunctional diguanylate cyclase/phosphodiesterase n=1 Tax=Spongiibacter TaxID=630749 RepID=UPI000C5A30E5|nr:MULTISPECIES: EAL domain-containing protein [Spongiibacter]MAY39822.1 hypothetical protein [Spongiibacter sp.]MBI57244.1 hypothetical protein [Spongiibacter sp.]|tara:strand:- start:2603 stop:4465 length:1863 start_codon:yes stop_codon:yes gene_type:complete